MPPARIDTRKGCQLIGTLTWKPPSPRKFIQMPDSFSALVRSDPPITSPPSYKPMARSPAGILANGKTRPNMPPKPPP